MSWGADEPKVIFPAHRKSHVFRGKIIAPVFLLATYDDKRVYGKKSFPDRMVRIDALHIAEISL
jgi:hypothetical protein